MIYAKKMLLLDKFDYPKYTALAEKGIDLQNISMKKVFLTLHPGWSGYALLPYRSSFLPVLLLSNGQAAVFSLAWYYHIDELC